MKSQSIFISHSWSDKKFAVTLASELRSQGLSVWMDHTHIKVGQKIARRVMDGISDCDYFLIILSQASTASNWVKEELDSAYFAAVSEGEDVILPVRLDDAPVPKELKNLKYADFSKGFQEGFTELMRVFEVKEDELSRLPRIEREKLIRKLLPLGDKWGEAPSQLIAAVEDESYLHFFEEHLHLSKDRQVLYNSVDVIRNLADYDYDHRIIRNHSSIAPLISLYSYSATH